MSTTACTALARMKSDASKGKLKDIIKDTSEGAGLRRAAINAVHGCGFALIIRHQTGQDWVRIPVGQKARNSGIDVPLGQEVWSLGRSLRRFRRSC